VSQSRGVVLPGGGGGGVTLVDWTQMDTTTEGSAPNDPSSVGDTGTGFTAGTFRHVWASNTAILQSYRSTNLLWWSYPVQTLYSTFDPDTMAFELCADLTQFGQGTADGAGVFVGIADDALSSASVNASISGLVRSGISAHQARKINTTSSTSGGTVTNGDQIYHSCDFAAATSAWRPVTTTRYRNTGSSPATYTVSTVSPSYETLGTTISSWRVVTGSFDINTTNPTTLDVQWAVYWRVILKASGHVA